MIMVSKRAPDCPCCGTNMIYKYPEANEIMPKTTHIVCAGCNEEYVLNKVELQALDHFMAAGEINRASRVLKHEEDVSFWVDVLPTPASEPAVIEDLPEEYDEPCAPAPVVDEGPQFGHISMHDASVWGSANPGIAVTPYGPNPFYNSGDENHPL